VHALDGLFQLPRLSQVVAVEAFNGKIRKQLGQRFLDALGAMAQRMQFIAAARAARRAWRFGAAVVAGEAIPALVYRQPRVAATAGSDPAAALAQQRRCVAAAVQLQQHLCACLQMALNGMTQRCGNALVHRMRPHVDQCDSRRYGAAGPFGQFDVRQAPEMHIVQ